MNYLADTNQPEVTITQNEQCVLQNDVKDSMNF
jgi:hypothetical protein